MTVPVVGDIAAGSPIPADEHVDDMLTLPRGLTGRGNVFGLRVRGDSMIDAAICDGDIVVVRQQPEAHSGQIVAAMIDGEATVKVYRRRDGHVYLEPRNPGVRRHRRRQRRGAGHRRLGPAQRLSTCLRRAANSAVLA